MRRREFFGLIGGAAAWSLRARSQPQSTRRIGFITVRFELHSPWAGPSRSIESSIASTAKTLLPRRRLGAEKGREIELFGHVADVWATQLNKWQSSRAAAN
jgi:hypothetical protein